MVLTDSYDNHLYIDKQKGPGTPAYLYPLEWQFSKDSYRVKSGNVGHQVNSDIHL